jgi:hypothetical protein
MLIDTDVLIWMTRGHEGAVGAVHPNKQLGGRPEYHNNLATYFFKENDPETRWKKEGLLLWEAMP